MKRLISMALLCGSAMGCSSAADDHSLSSVRHLQVAAADLYVDVAPEEYKAGVDALRMMSVDSYFMMLSEQLVFAPDSLSVDGSAALDVTGSFLDTGEAIAAMVAEYGTMGDYFDAIGVDLSRPLGSEAYGAAVSDVLEHYGPEGMALTDEAADCRNFAYGDTSKCAEVAAGAFTAAQKQCQDNIASYRSAATPDRNQNSARQYTKWDGDKSAGEASIGSFCDSWFGESGATIQDNKHMFGGGHSPWWNWNHAGVSSNENTSFGWITIDREKFHKADFNETFNQAAQGVGPLSGGCSADMAFQKVKQCSKAGINPSNQWGAPPTSQGNPVTATCGRGLLCLR